MLVRPADLRLGAVGSGALAGTVVTQSFLGPVTRLTVRLSGEELVRVDTASENAAAYPPSTEVGLAVEPDAAMLAASPAV